MAELPQTGDHPASPPPPSHPRRLAHQQPRRHLHAPGLHSSADHRLWVRAHGQDPTAARASGQSPATPAPTPAEGPSPHQELARPRPHPNSAGSRRVPEARAQPIDAPDSAPPMSVHPRQVQTSPLRRTAQPPQVPSEALAQSTSAHPPPAPGQPPPASAQPSQARSQRPWFRNQARSQDQPPRGPNRPPQPPSQTPQPPAQQSQVLAQPQSPNLPPVAPRQPPQVPDQAQSPELPRQAPDPPPRVPDLPR